MIRILNQAKFEMRNFRDRPVPRIWPNSGVSAAFENDMVHTMGMLLHRNVDILHCLVWRNFFYLAESQSFWYLLSEIDYRFYNEL